MASICPLSPPALRKAFERFAEGWAFEGAFWLGKLPLKWPSKLGLFH